MPRRIADRLDQLAALLVSIGFKHPALIDPLKEAGHRLRAVAACADAIDRKRPDPDQVSRLLDAIGGEHDDTHFL